MWQEIQTKQPAWHWGTIIAYRTTKISLYAEPAPLHHFTTPSSPPVTKAPELPAAGGLGLQESAHTLSVSWTVETAARAPISQTLMLFVC